MNKFLVAGLVVCVIATIACILSTSIPYWAYAHINAAGTDISSAAGLWKVCSRVESAYNTQTSCVTIEASSWLKGVRAMMILGVLLLALSTTLAIFYMWKYSTNNLVYISAVSTAAFGGIVVVIGFAVYASKSDLGTTPAYYSGGFYLAILSAVLAFVAASLFALSKRSSGGYSTI